jgi:hypothetical protein
MKTLREEIKRIKSLFTEERMYGNLSESNPDTNNDGTIDSDEFRSSGDEITSGEADEFLSAQGFKVISNPGAKKEDTVVEYCAKKSNMSKVYELVKDKGLNNRSEILNNFHATGGVCYYYLNNKNAAEDGELKVKKIAVWDDYTITFYVQLPYDIDLSNEDEAAKSFESFTPKTIALIEVNESFGSDYGEVRYIKFSGKFDFAGMTSGSLKFMNFRDNDLKKVNLDGVLFDQIEEKKYNPLTDQSGVATGPRMYGGGLTLEGILNKLGVGMSF